jgi:DNA-binding transcriptional MerR regulator
MYTIGEFAHLSQVSSRMLRHYDKLGLLRPALTDGSNGYRYYDATQLSTLRQIEALKEYGFSLADIRGLLQLPQAQLAERIHGKRLEAYGRLHALRQTLSRMECDIQRMEGRTMYQEKYSMVIMAIPAQRVLGLRRVINVSQIHDLFQELRQQMAERGLRQAGVTQLLYHGREFSYDHMDCEAQIQVAGNHADVQETPEQLCLATTHIGAYDTVYQAYQALNGYLAQHPEYEVCGPCMERYLKDEGMTQSPEEYETGILFPIRQRT